MLYTKPILEISWSDVEDFCKNRVPEGAYLDYKEDFPNQLEKTISAMANTFGGIILIGVAEDNERKPIIPIKGVKFERGLSERVTNIILSHITPPVFPEIQICIKPQEESVALIVIRIPQSHETPHAISSSTKVYLRTGEMNNPEELASIKDIAWLTNQREKSIFLRDHLNQQAENRYSVFYQRLGLSELANGRKPKETKTGIFTITACPTYPKHIYQTPTQLMGIHEKISVKDFYGTDRVFPPFNNRMGGAPLIVQDGVVIINNTDDLERVFYTEINSRGLYFFRQPVKREIVSEHNTPREVLKLSELIARIDEFIDSACKLYNEFSYWGYLNLQIELSSIFNS